MQELNWILFLRHDASKPIEKTMTSGCDVTRTIYCELALTVLGSLVVRQSTYVADWLIAYFLRSS